MSSRRLAPAALLLGGSGWWAHRRIEGLERELAAARDTLGLLLGPDTRAVTVPISTGGRPGAVTIVVDRATRRWLVRCERMAPNDPDQTYQLWFVTEAGMKRAALMTMTAGQPSVMTLAFPAPDEVGRVVGLAMSIEPRGGSAEPRGPMLLHVDL